MAKKPGSQPVNWIGVQIGKTPRTWNTSHGSKPNEWMGAIEFVADRENKKRFDLSLKVGGRISKAARDRGLIARAMPHGDILGFARPLVTTKDEVDEIVSIAEKAVRAVMDELVRGDQKL